jgi:hypothetical protein
MPDEFDIRRHEPARSVHWQDKEIEYTIDEIHSDYPQFDRQTIRREVEKRMNQFQPEDGIDKMIASLREAFGRLT